MTTLTATAPTVKPITAKDQIRARTWGLQLPASAPLAEAAPAIETNPRESWPAWTDADRWELGPDVDGPRPTAGPDFEPGDLDSAEWLGMSLRLAGEPMAELVTNRTGLLLRFAVGQALGLELRQREELADREACMSRDARFEAWLAERDRAFVEFDSYRDSEPRETDGFAPGYTA
jgi:hypothetical protein